MRLSSIPSTTTAPGELPVYDDDGIVPPMDLPSYCDLLELLITTAEDSVISAACADDTNDTARIKTRMNAETMRFFLVTILLHRLPRSHDCSNTRLRFGL